MAANYCHDESSSVWACACAPGQSFCATCLLRHLQDQGLHQASYRGPLGQFVCGMCKGTAGPRSSSIYPVCLCSSCVVGLSAARGTYGEEVQAKLVEAARPEQAFAETVDKEQTAHFSLHALLAQKRKDISQHLSRVFDNMNNFEEIIAQAMLYEQELEQCKEKLSKAEAALEERQQRVQGERRDVADLGQIAGIMKDIASVNQENGRVTAENHALIARVQALEMQVGNQFSLNRRVEALTAEIANLKAELQETLQKQAEEYAKLTVNQIQDTLKDKLEWTARTTAEKVADVIPMVAHLKLDSAWLNTEIAENLFQLASLSITDKLDSAEMRLVARVSILLAKLLGPCEDMAIFSKGIPALFKQNPDRACAQFKNLEVVYLAAKGEADFKDVVKDMMKRLKDRECEEALKVSAKFCKVLSPKGICEFAKSVLNFFKKKDPTYNEWKGALSEFPVEWADPPLASKCLESLMMKIIYSNFSAEHLALVQLLEIYRPADEATLLAFLGRAGTLLNRDSVKRALHDYILEAKRYVENSMRVQGAKGQQLCELVYANLNLISEHATVEEIGKSLQVLREFFKEITAIRDFDATPDNIGSLLRGLDIDQYYKISEITGMAVALILAEQLEPLFNSLLVFSKLVKYREPIALALTKEVHSVLLNVPNERTQLSQILRTAARVLCSASPATPLVAKCFTAWKDGRARGAAQISTFCHYVLNRLRILNTEEMLDSVIAAFAEGDSAHAVVSTLLEIHVEDGLDPSTLIRYLTALKGIQGAQVLNPLLAKARNRLLLPRHQALFFDAVLDLCTPETVQTLCDQIDLLLDNPEITILLRVLSQLQESGVTKDLLDAARQNPKVVPVARQLASVYVELQTQEILETNIPQSVKIALLQRPVEMGELLSSVMALLQSCEREMRELCVKVLGEFGARTKESVELLVVVCDVTKDLVEFVEPKAVLALGNLILEATDETQKTNLRTNLPHIKERLIELLKKVQERVTLQEIFGLMEKPTQQQATELANVQPSLMRFFDFKTSQWGQAVQLKRQIQCYSGNGSSYTFLDSDRLFCCGGTFQAGFNSGSTVHTANQPMNVAFLLNRDGTVTDLPSMKGARYYHGIIFIHSNRTTYVFGGSKW